MNEHRAGPVRSAAAREAILDATARLFHSVGYEHLTIEGIAREAGVGKQTIYRWWPSRGALIADCLIDGRLIPLELEVPDTGDLVADVGLWLDTVLGLLDSPNGYALMRSLIAAAAEDAGVGEHLGSSLGVNRFLAERLESAVRAGELPPDAPVDRLGDAILGAIVVSALGDGDRAAGESASGASASGAGSATGTSGAPGAAGPVVPPSATLRDLVRFLLRSSA